jgi:hypothetical protein
MRLRRRDDLQPTGTAMMLWLIVAAMLIGWVAELVFGHPVVLMP